MVNYFKEVVGEGVDTCKHLFTSVKPNLIEGYVEKCVAIILFVLIYETQSNMN